jgi:hypothetical protein
MSVKKEISGFTQIRNGGMGGGGVDNLSKIHVKDLKKNSVPTGYIRM